jgi:hypothetical protein
MVNPRIITTGRTSLFISRSLVNYLTFAASPGPRDVRLGTAWPILAPATPSPLEEYSMSRFLFALAIILSIVPLVACTGAVPTKGAFKKAFEMPAGPKQAGK